MAMGVEPTADDDDKNGNCNSDSELNDPTDSDYDNDSGSHDHKLLSDQKPKLSQWYLDRCDYANYLLETNGIPPLDAHTWKPYQRKRKRQPQHTEDPELPAGGKLNEETQEMDMNCNNADPEGNPPPDPPLTTPALKPTNPKI